MALLDMIQQKAFLGSEFLTWLWYRSEQEDGSIEIEPGQPCEISFEKDLVLASEAGQAVASSLKGESPSLAPEAVAALMAGKKVKRARVSLTCNHTHWEVVLNGETFDWSGVKIDTPPSLPFVESVPIRLNAVEEFARIFDLLFSKFLDVRLSSDTWRPEVEAMRAWVESKAAGPGDEELE
jgi:hypothetical protein